MLFGLGETQRKFFTSLNQWRSELGSSLVQIMACHLSGALSLLDPMLTYFQPKALGIIAGKLSNFLSTKCSWKHIFKMMAILLAQWETSLQSNNISHWLGANLESALVMAWMPSYSQTGKMMDRVKYLDVFQLTWKWLFSMGWHRYLFHIFLPGNFWYAGVVHLNARVWCVGIDTPQQV